MNQQDIEILLIDAVNEIQEISGREVAEITPTTKPLSEVGGFDSLNGVEVTVDIEEQLKTTFKFNNVFVDDNAELTIRQAAHRVVASLEICK